MVPRRQTGHLLMAGPSVTDREALRENKEAGVCLSASLKMWLSDELQKQTLCNNHIGGPPVTVLHPVLPPNQLPC